MTKAGLLAIVDREIRLREKTYPRWVAMGRLSPGKAGVEIAGMKDVRAAIVKHVPDDAVTQPGLFA